MAPIEYQSCGIPLIKTVLKEEQNVLFVTKITRTDIKLTSKLCSNTEPTL